MIGALLMKIAFSCVVDNDPKYARQAVLWAASLLIHGVQDAESLVVHTVGEGEPRLRALLNSWGVDVVQIEAFDARHRYSNKLAQFESASLQNADLVVLCDCDLAFAASISPWLKGEESGPGSRNGLGWHQRNGKRSLRRQTSASQRIGCSLSMAHRRCQHFVTAVSTSSRKRYFPNLASPGQSGTAGSWSARS